MNAFRYSAQAHADIESIALYTFDLNPLAAHHFLDALDHTCDLLAVHPLMGRSRPELGSEVRSFPVGNYLIFYIPASDGIDVARVIYGGRDLSGAYHS
jgi:toxin ParE1/3/4